MEAAEASVGDLAIGMSWLLFIGLSAYVAHRKGRNPWLWGALAAVTWFIALVIVSLLGTRRETPSAPAQGGRAPE